MRRPLQLGSTTLVCVGLTYFATITSLRKEKEICFLGFDQHLLLAQ